MGLAAVAAQFLVLARPLSLAEAGYTSVQAGAAAIRNSAVAVGAVARNPVGSVVSAATAGQTMVAAAVETAAEVGAETGVAVVARNLAVAVESSAAGAIKAGPCSDRRKSVDFQKAVAVEKPDPEAVETRGHCRSGSAALALERSKNQGPRRWPLSSASYGSFFCLTEFFLIV
jgi:hypothetical protein